MHRLLSRRKRLAENRLSRLCAMKAVWRIFQRTLSICTLHARSVLFLYGRFSHAFFER